MRASDLAPTAPAAGASTDTHLELCYASAHQALALGDHENAARLFGLLALMAPYDARGWLGLGRCRELANELPLALALYGMAPHSPWCLLARARVARALGRPQLADRYLDEARLAAEDAEAHGAICEERWRS
jgi:tetratricopeptide (TPR) repeat protein